MNPVKKFHAPATLMCSGASQSGKTTFVLKLLKHAPDMFDIPPVKIVYCFTEMQHVLAEAERTIPNFVLHEGVPTHDDVLKWTEPGKHVILVLDDMMRQISTSDEALHWVTVLSHHRTCSLIYITQNIFERGKHFRSISLNIHIFVLMVNNRDRKQLIAFATQAMPKQSGFFIDAYEKAISRVPLGGYLLCDLSPYSEKQYRLRTSIFPSDEVTVVYRPKV